LVFFVVAGGLTVEMAFGKKYAGLELLTALLACGWAARLLALASSMAIMATGDTKTNLVAVTIRASSLVLALYAAFSGYGLTGIAAAGIAGDIPSLAYFTWRTETTGKGHAAFLGVRTCFVLPVVLAASLTAQAVAGHTVLTFMATLLLALSVTAVAVTMMPRSRSALVAFVASTAARLLSSRAAVAAQ
jgi:O-antigen/teichoic acid export membrane protein